jgi:hypothetical protein
MNGTRSTSEQRKASSPASTEACRVAPPMTGARQRCCNEPIAFS